MKAVFRKLVPIIVIASILLSACGGPPQVDDINWTDPESVQEFGDIEEAPIGDDVEYSDVDSSDLGGVDEYPTDMGECSQKRINDNECFGNEDLGFDEIPDGNYQVFVDGKCYILDKNDTDINSMKVAMEQIKEKTDYINLLALGAGLDVGFMLASIAGLSACSFLGAATPVGWVCALGLIGLAATLGVGVVDIIEINKAGDVIESQTQELHRIVSGKQRCN